MSEGSGWTIEEIRSHFVNIVKYQPLRGNSYLPLPIELRNSNKGLINPKNVDDKCFLWCHVRHLNPQKDHAYRIKLSDREFAKKLDYSGITFLVTINQINRIEKQNKINIIVFGYDCERKSAFPNRVSQEHYDDHMELLYLDNEPLEKVVVGGRVFHGHYVYIKDFNKFMFNFTKQKGKKHFCMHCLQCFYSNIS